MAPRIYENARERILDATERLLLERGHKQLSVDAVITEVGISKGGFFHHFPTKDALLVALLDRLVERVFKQIEQLAAQDPEPRGAMLRAQINLAFDGNSPEINTSRTLMLAFLEAVSSSPAIAERARTLNAETLARDVREDIPAGRAMLIQFALDGFWLAESLASYPLPPQNKKALRDSLLALAQPEATVKSSARRTAVPKKGRSR